jgi:hypothetical protein
MKKILFISLFVIFCAKTSMAEKVYLDEYIRGADTGRRIIADISLPETGTFGKDHIVWHEVFIAPSHGITKEVELTPEIYSLDDGNITNLNLSRNKITFRINLSYYSLAVATGERYMDVVVTTKMDGSIDNVSGFSQWTDLKTNKIFNVEWVKSSRSYFKLPYNVVF